MASNNNLNNNRGNNNNRNHGNRHFNDRDHNNRKRNNSSEGSKPGNNFLFSKGNVLDLIRKLPLIKNKMRVEGVYSIFYGKAKSFTVRRPQKLFSYNGPGAASRPRPSRVGSSDSSSEGDSSGDEDYKTPKSSVPDVKSKISKNRRRLSTIAFEDSELVPDIDDLEDVDLNMADIYFDDEIVSFSDYRRESREIIRKRRTSHELPDDDFEDDGGGGGDDDHHDEDGDNDSRSSVAD